MYSECATLRYLQCQKFDQCRYHSLRSSVSPKHACGSEHADIQATSVTQGGFDIDGILSS